MKGQTASIGVRDLLLHIRKGLYETELTAGNRFRVSAEVTYQPAALEPGAYLNYEVLVKIIAEEMQADEHLLETIADKMLRRMLNEWPAALSASVRIEKLNPAFTGLQTGAVYVEQRMER